MKENASHRLHPILEGMIVAVTIFGMTLLTRWLLTPYNLQIIQSAAWLYTVLSFVTRVVAMFLGGMFCFKVIEKYELSAGTLLLISILLPLLFWVPNTLLSNYIARFGVDYLVRYTRINTYALPVLYAAIMTAIVRMLHAPKTPVSDGDSSARIGLAAHVLLLLFVGGIWRLIWIYRTTRYLNCVPGEEYRNPGTKLLLCMLVPFYSIYWVYKSAQRIDKLAMTKDVNSDLTVACLILEIFIPLIPPILMQDKINKIVDASRNHLEF